MNLDFLRPLYERPGEYASVYLDTSRDHEEGVQQTELRWRDARTQLTSQGADAATLDAMGAALAGPTAAGRAVFGQAGRMLLTEALPAPPRREIARWARLPHVMPLLAQRAPHLGYLMVTARHDGGEITMVGPAGGELDQEVAGSGWPIHKTGQGGWAARRYENSTEEAWEVNAKELATQVTAAAARVHAELIVLGGDVRSRSLLLDQMGTDLAAITTTIDREIPSDSATAAQDAAQVIADQAAARSRERFAHWQNQQAQRRGVAGLAATMAALRDGAVAEVLLADHPTSARTAWIGPAPTDLAVSPAELTDRGVPEPVTDRADAALARAMAATGAQLYFLPEDVAAPEDGIGALLRYPVDAVG